MRERQCVWEQVDELERNIFLGWTHEGKTVRMRTGRCDLELGRRMFPNKVVKVDIILEDKELFREGMLGRGNEMTKYEVLDYAECRML